MSTLTVKNPKKFALTKGKKYEILDEQENRVRIVNDNNIQAFYGKSLCEDPKPKVPVLEDVVNSVVFDPNNGPDGQVTITVLGQAYTTAINLECERPKISCGIREVWGLNGFATGLAAFLAAIEVVGMTAPFKKAVVKAMFEATILGIMEEEAEEAGIFMLSTNTNGPNFGLINDVLQPMAVTDYTAMNPGSENEIKLWIITQQ